MAPKRGKHVCGIHLMFTLGNKASVGQISACLLAAFCYVPPTHQYQPNNEACLSFFLGIFDGSLPSKLF